MDRGFASGIVLAGGLLLCSSQALASLFEPVGDQQLVCEATDIIRGRVTSVQSAWDAEHAAIWTTATVQVQEAIRGTLAADAVIQVKEVGGTVGDYTVVAEGFPTFQANEEIVVLLRPWEDGSGVYRVWAYGRGKFSIARRGGRPASAARHDVVESGQPTMFTDRIPPSLLLDGLTQELNALARQCDRGRRPQ